MAQKPKFPGLLVITSGSPLAWTQINALRDAIGPFPVLQVTQGEDQIDEELGALTRLSHIAARKLFNATARFSEPRVEEIIEVNKLRTEPDLDQYIMKIVRADTVRCEETVRNIAPKVVFVIDAGSVTRDTVSAVDAPFIRYHGAFHPKYSNAFGGYTALASGNADAFGACLHIMEPNGGAGDVIAQVSAPVEPGDNIHTYPWRIAAHARAMTVRTLASAISENVSPCEVEAPEKAPPVLALGQYISAGLSRGVW